MKCCIYHRVTLYLASYIPDERLKTRNSSRYMLAAFV